MIPQDAGSLLVHLFPETFRECVMLWVALVLCWFLQLNVVFGLGKYCFSNLYHHFANIFSQLVKSLQLIVVEEFVSH